MKKLLLASGILFFAFITNAQTVKTDVITPPAKDVFFELGGPGFASFNYDMRFKGESGLGFRAGFGGFNVDGDGVIFVPLGLNYLLGKDEKNYFELGAGPTILAGSDDVTFGDDDKKSTVLGHLNFGYRYQPKKGGFTFRAAINPLFGNGFFLPYYGGVSFGYKF